MDLLAWLDAAIFPTEQHWADRGAAEHGATIAWSRLIHAGTLSFAGYLTSHPHTLDAVTHVHERFPLRTIAGQVLMDRHGPDNLTRQPVNDRQSERDRLTFSVNPRFAISCTADLLTRAGHRAQQGAIVQTHLAEQVAECAMVQTLFPDSPHYTGVYDRFGLLTPRTLLAHGVHLSDDEWRLIVDRRSVVVHCPTANLFLQSGLFDLDAAREHGVRLALGSDVAAGPDLAMPRVARAMIETAKVRRMTHEGAVHVPTPAEAWRLITRGNADALGFTDGGRLEPGAQADLLVLCPPFEADEHLIGRLIYTWRDEYIAHRIVAGEAVDVPSTR
jgi:guanine deaminase